MLKKVCLRVLQLSVGILTFVALTNVASACSIISYQPEIPEELQ